MHLHISKLLITGFVRRLSGNGAGFANKSVGNCYSLNLQTTNDPFNHQMHDIIDVRSPLEYQDDHIPGAINLPVLSNYERHIIGQEYNQNSFEARRHGASLISRNIHKILHDHFMDKEKKHSFLVYCWRGGQRSKSFALVLNMIGYTVKCLDGGYKNYRKQIVSRLSCISSQLRYNVITGMTGTGKTLLLNYLEDIGEQVLDLEALANHKGSVLGRNYENQSQPSTRWFESCLYRKLASFDKSKPVWVEAEGRRIGDLQIPDSVFTSISSNILHCYTLEADIESRIRYIMSDYDYLCKNPAILKQELGRLQKLRLPLRKWYTMIDNGKLECFVQDILENHYDPMYRKSQSRNIARNVPQGDRIILNIESIDTNNIYESLLSTKKDPIVSATKL